MDAATPRLYSLTPRSDAAWAPAGALFHGGRVADPCSARAGISLYYLGQWGMEAFEFAHLYLWQALIMLDVLVVWLLWMRLVARQSGTRLAPAQ